MSSRSEEQTSINVPTILDKEESKQLHGNTNADVEIVNIEDPVQFLLRSAQNHSNIISPSIHMIPSRIRDLNPRVFDPRQVSIGPLHKKKKNLKAFEGKKATFLHDLLHPLGPPQEKILEKCVHKVNVSLGKIKEFYGDGIKSYTDDQITRMMVMDGCFILEFIYKRYKGLFDKKMVIEPMSMAFDLVLLENQIPFFVLQDIFECTSSRFQPGMSLHGLIILGLVPALDFFESKFKIKKNKVFNEIDHILGFIHECYKPLFVVEIKPSSDSNKYVEINQSSDSDKDVEINQSSDSDKDVEINQSSDSNNNVERNQSSDEDEDVEINQPSDSDSDVEINCTLSDSGSYYSANQRDSLSDSSSYYSATEINGGTDSSEVVGIIRLSDSEKFYSAVELDMAGVNFKCHHKPQNGKWSMDIKLEFPVCSRFRPWANPTLRMPVLRIHNYTELIFRNLIAYEQLSPVSACHYVTSYAIAMDRLIDSHEDVAILVKSEVLINTIGSNEEAAKLINGMCKDICCPHRFYIKEWEDLNTYHDRPWPKYIARLRRTYLSNPWTIIALFAGIFLFLFTMVQTIFTVKLV